MRLTPDGLNSLPRFSPDGRRIVYISSESPTLRTMDIDGGNRKTIVQQDGMVFPAGACWSPDGRHLAVVFREWVKKTIDGNEFQSLGNAGLKIMDAEGENRRNVKIEDADVEFLYAPPDWR